MDQINEKDVEILATGEDKKQVRNMVGSALMACCAAINSVILRCVSSCSLDGDLQNHHGNRTIQV